MVAEGNIKDWLSWKTKEIQREIEAHDLLTQQPSIDMTAPAIIDVDVKEAFLSIHKQPLFDAFARTASKDYPSANIKKGELMNTPDIMKICPWLVCTVQDNPNGTLFCSAKSRWWFTTRQP